MAHEPLGDIMPVRRRKRTISEYMSTRKNDYVTCAAVESARKIGNQWRLIVIRYLLERPMRFNELLRAACEIDTKTLSRVLKYLASEKIVQREVLGTQPFTVRYALTDKGEQIRPVMQSLKAWGRDLDSRRHCLENYTEIISQSRPNVVSVIGNLDVSEICDDSSPTR